MVLKTKSGDSFIIDKSDYSLIKDYSYGTHKIEYKTYQMKYVACFNGSDKELLHRIIMNPKDGFIIDHIDHNGLNNKRENLRICTYSNNQANRKPSNLTSKYKGVSRAADKYTTVLWRAQITKDGKCYNLGRFDNEIDAALAYDKKAIDLHGEEFSLTNKDLGLI